MQDADSSLPSGRALNEQEAPRSSLRASRRSELPRRLSDAQIEQGWRDTFSTNNPFCPCDLKTFTKAARWTEAQLARERNELLAALVDVIGWVPGPTAWHTDAPQKAVNNARAAIAKATGK